MKSIEFVYWLQGCFEMGDVTSFNEEQFSTIEKHLKMVEIVEAKQQLPFCFWIRGIVDTQENRSLDKRITKIIKERLNSIFEHAVNQPTGAIQQTSQPQDVSVRC